MADPLSLTASIIAVVGAADSVGKTINKIRDIREAPNDLIALINEISDLRIVLGDMESYLTQNKSNVRPQQEQLQHMSTLLDRAKERLLRLDEIVQFKLVQPESTPTRVRISRQQWARATSTVKKFRRSLQDIRLNIIAQMVVVNAYVSKALYHTRRSRLNIFDRSYQSRIGLMVDEIRLGTTELCLRNQDQTIQRLNEHSGLLTDILSNQAELRSFLQTQSSLRSQRFIESGERHPSNPIILIKARANYQRLPCTLYCKCICHESWRFNSPRWVRKAIGTLFVGYSGYPMGLLRRCNQANCQRQRGFQISVDYLFPSWFLTRIIAVSVTKNGYREVYVSLKLQRLVSESAEIFRLTHMDDVAGLQRLFSKGLASPNDIDCRRGRSPLHDAITTCRWKACRFLLDAGADPNFNTLSRLYIHSVKYAMYGWINIFLSSSPKDIAWNRIFQASYDHITLETVRSLFPINDELLEERQFSRLHKIVLGLSPHSLAEELATCDIDINVFDADNYTPLAWAARRGDDNVVCSFLRANANPNTRDRLSNTPLIQAAASSNANCVRLLLEAGASPGDKNYLGYNALHFAAWNCNNEEIALSMIAAGVDLEARTFGGSTPLATAANANNITTAAILLDSGANINSLDNDGDTPLHASLHWHHDGCTQLLLSRGASYILPYSLGGSLLHIVAKSSGLQTLEILQAAGLHGIDPALKDQERKTALQLAQQREGKDLAFLEKFQTLLTEIHARNTSQATSGAVNGATRCDSSNINTPESPLQASATTATQRPHAVSQAELLTQQARFSHIVPTYFQLVQDWIRDLYTTMHVRLSQSMWISTLIYCILGLGWAGFIYMIFLRQDGVEPEL